MLFDEKPVIALFARPAVHAHQVPAAAALFARPAVHAHQVPAAAELFALEGECEMALGEAFVWIVFRLPVATVPDHDRAATIFTLGDRAFELVISYRMILN